MKLKIVNRYSKSEKKFRIFRFIFNKRTHVLKVSLWPKLWHFKALDGGRPGKSWYYDVAVTILGLRMHWKRGFGLKV